MKKNLLEVVLLAAATAIAGCGDSGSTSAAASDACSTKDITLSNVVFERKSDTHDHITMIVHNGCKKAIGVEISLAVLRENGDVAWASNNLWPNSVKNIPAGADFPFEWIARRVEGKTRVSYRVNSVKDWDAQ